jgi:hypothetical protein
MIWASLKRMEISFTAVLEYKNQFLDIFIKIQQSPYCKINGE